MAYKSRWFVTRKVDKVSGCYKYFPQKHVFQKQKLPQFMEESNRKSCKNFQTYSYFFYFIIVILNISTDVKNRPFLVAKHGFYELCNDYVMTIDYQTDQLAIWHNTIRHIKEIKQKVFMEVCLQASILKFCYDYSQSLMLWEFAQNNQAVFYRTQL